LDNILNFKTQILKVSLGEPLDVKDADDQLHLKLPKGKHSVRGVGKIVPDPKGTKIM
jgi:hypothetical protein